MVRRAELIYSKHFRQPNLVFPLFFTPYFFYKLSSTQPLFQGNKFFFSAGTAAEGTELWISDGVDGTVAHTHIVKDINPGAADSDPGTPGLLSLYNHRIILPGN